jgi:hypothetical protein
MKERYWLMQASQKVESSSQVKKESAGIADRKIMLSILALRRLVRATSARERVI